MRLIILTIILLVSTTLLAQDDSTATEDSLENNNEGNIHSIWKKKYGQELIIIDGVTTTNTNSSLRGNAIDWYISHSIGYSPDESKPVFLISLTTTNNYSIHYGLKGGVYNYSVNLNEAVNGFLQSLGPLNAGFYTVQGLFAVTRSPTYIGALTGSYDYNRRFFLNAAFGFKYYSEDTYMGEISFDVVQNGSSAPQVNVTPLAPFQIYQTKDVIRAYYSLGVDYHIGGYRFGLYCDNIYSFGFNIGVGF